LTATADELNAKKQQISLLQDDLEETEDRIVILEEKITQEEGSSVGDLAPAFELKNLNGDAVSLYDYWGSPVLLNFWATWCGPCRYEMPFLQDIYEEWQDDGLIIITINLRESSDKIRQFMKEYELTFPVLLDTGGEISRKYFVTGIPTTYFLDEYGVIKVKKVGSFTSKQQIEDYVKEIIQ
jgi:thiol-disulfide isomerase/thioredoxin